MENNSKQNKRNKWLSRVLIAVSLLLLLFMVRLFVLTPMIVGGNSMIRPYKKGAYVLVSKLKYPRVGDVVVFRNPAITKGNKSMKLMGRIIAEPGDLLDAHANKLYRNGHALNIPFALKENFKRMKD